MLNETSNNSNTQKISFYENLKISDFKNNEQILEELRSLLNFSSNKLEQEVSLFNELENNFYFYNFLQLKNIMILFNTCNYSSFIHGSYRLIIQFLYITRYLKEGLELKNSESNQRNIKIVDHCFKKFFEFDWILSLNIANKEFSYIIRSEILNLFIAYLEEKEENIDNDFANKIYSSLTLQKIFNEIIICLKYLGNPSLEAVKDVVNEHRERHLSYQELFTRYIDNEENYKSRHCELAELYYKLLRHLEPLYLELKNIYFKLQIFYAKENKVVTLSDRKRLKAQTSGLFNDINYFIGKIDSIQTNNFYLENKAYYQFLMMIGKEIEVKFKESKTSYNYKKLYFFKSPKCFWMNKSFKSQYMLKVPRGSLGAKLDYLTQKIDKLLFTINLSFKYRPKFLQIGGFYKNFSFYFFELLNFILILILNILLLIRFTKPASGKFEPENLQHQVLIDKNSQEFTEIVTVIFYWAILNSFVELIILLVWFYFRFSLHIRLLFFSSMKKNFLFSNFKNEIDYKNNSVSNYHKIVTDFENMENPFLTQSPEGSRLRNCVLYIRAFIWNKEIQFIILSLVCHILFLITKYQLLLVIPVISIINLYELFEYFWRSIKNKYQQFIAILVFIYLVEYIFSWIIFLHYQDFLVGDMVFRNDDMFKSVRK